MTRSPLTLSADASRRGRDPAIARASRIVHSHRRRGASAPWVSSAGEISCGPCPGRRAPDVVRAGPICWYINRAHGPLQNLRRMWRRKVHAMTRLMLGTLFLVGVISACSRAPAPRARGRADPHPHTAHKQLDLKQLKALSIECEKYLPGQFARGPYDAAYCQAAIDAWGDAPLQMVRIPPARRTRIELQFPSAPRLHRLLSYVR